MSKLNRGFIRLLLGTSATITARDEGPIFLSFCFAFFFFFRQTQKPVQSSLLRRFGFKSRTKTQHILTANHHGDADIFLKKDGEKRWWALLLRPLAKLHVSTPSPGCWMSAASSIITRQTAEETRRGERSRPNKDRFQVSAC